MATVSKDTEENMEIMWEKIIDPRSTATEVYSCMHIMEEYLHTCNDISDHVKTERQAIMKKILLNYHQTPMKFDVKAKEIYFQTLDRVERTVDLDYHSKLNIVK